MKIRFMPNVFIVPRKAWIAIAAMTGRGWWVKAPGYGEVLAQRDAEVEDEAVALPAAFGGGDVFQVAQDAALELVDVWEPRGAEVGAGFFAAYAAGAEEGDFWVFFGG